MKYAMWTMFLVVFKFGSLRRISFMQKSFPDIEEKCQFSQKCSNKFDFYITVKKCAAMCRNL